MKMSRKDTCMIPIEIYFRDLSPKCQAEFKELLGEDCVSEHNWETFPIVTYECYDDEND